MLSIRKNAFHGAKVDRFARSKNRSCGNCRVSDNPRLAKGQRLYVRFDAIHAEKGKSVLFKFCRPDRAQRCSGIGRHGARIGWINFVKNGEPWISCQGNHELHESHSLSAAAKMFRVNYFFVYLSGLCGKKSGLATVARQERRGSARSAFHSPVIWRKCSKFSRSWCNEVRQ